MDNKNKYWKSLGELNNNPEIQQLKENEFQEQLPADIFSDEKINEASTSRRDFLKFLGFSVGAAALASCETPVTKTIPYVVKPENVYPGKATWYASTYDDGNDYCNVLVKTREGRPIKLEGNKNSVINAGGVNARVQGSILSIYDKVRYRNALKTGKNIAWSDADSEIKNKLNEIVAAGKKVVVLSSTVTSPSAKSAINEFAAKYGATHITADPVSVYAIKKAHAATHNKSDVPSYNFANANVVVGIACDFLLNWISPVEFSKQYAKNRKVNKDKKDMSKHYQVESTLSVTGSSADVRVPLKPSLIGAAVVSLYNELTGGNLPVSGNIPAKEIKEMAESLKANRGKSLVVCGVNDFNIQLVVNEINKFLGNYGSTLDINNPTYLRSGNDESFLQLADNMKAGNVGAIFFYRSNPVYTAASMKFAELLKGVSLKVSLSNAPDETAALCDYVCPDNHYLESWTDSNPKKGVYAIGQPAIAPLFKTRNAIESFLKWSGNSADAHNYIMSVWQNGVYPLQSKYGDFYTFWNYTLHDGFVSVGGNYVVHENTTADTTATKTNGKKVDAKEQESPVSVAGDVASAANAISHIKSSGFDIVVYEKAGLGNGSNANNPWLIELPDPISKVTWDHYVTMNPEDMKGKYAMLERQDMIGDKATVTYNGFSETLPVFPQPGQARGTIAIALGYGRKGVGKVAKISGGSNAYNFVKVENGYMQYAGTNANISAANGEKFHFACTQQHHTMMGRKIVNETSINIYKNSEASHWNHKEKIAMFDEKANHVKKDLNDANLWNEHPMPGHHWGLAIDLNSCTGCSACMISCQAENNTAVVGRDQISNTRDMYWIRIDRYYSSPMDKKTAKKENKGAIDMYLEMENPHTDNPQVVFQPVMCQHCNHAPCETVCPVLATNHSNEGLNHMAYNRCIGTRYCANNCPYKVRKFNWYNYNGNYRFKDINPAFESDQLGRLVLNPDVVVRSRGVMEKCSMCVQRIQEGKLKAKVEQRKIADGEIQTACSQSCPTNAIVFGDLNDKGSEISKLFADDRSYFLLEEVGIKPNVAYLTKVRNIEGQIDHEEHNKQHEEKQTEKKEEHV